ncbi:cysteine peptidase family C39 domain-containing protein [Caballeronia sp. LZ029]|uniref:C39 family peptidase n=1 Tax=Caballeronia sp. LZ029 TaxID=3038564 RepID=UPI00285F1C51|nr:cysteine peptidase family C39 domain-containing protein [Caballeronia sp. LZ029]MDR5742511.1 cysteine peptidase family C39 domain-containing protein [Caballeronia sp. LZ029]
MRFEGTTPQFLDYTCGAASLSTLLTFYWSYPTTEQSVLEVLRQRYTREEMAKITQDGLSFDDLIYIATQLGFSAEGARIEIGQLKNMSGPVIVHLDKGTFQHFVVLRSVGDGVFYLSDPAAGAVTMHADEFQSFYTGHALAVWKDGAKLPSHTWLTNPRDGINLNATLSNVINRPPGLPSRGF